MKLAMTVVVTTLLVGLIARGVAPQTAPAEPSGWSHEAAAKYLQNSLLLVWHGGGHVPIATPCAEKLAAQFLAKASTSGLDTGCVADFRRPAFQVK